MTDYAKTGKLGRRTRCGVSLIEVLIVLVILVFGILTIIRLFPSGFFSVEQVGNTATADTLGIAAISAQTQDSVGLPDAILPGTMNSLGVPTATVADGEFDPERAQNLDGDPLASPRGYNAHVIHNETVTVPSARTGQSVYVLNYGPIQMGSVNPAFSVTQLLPYVSINSLPWTSSTADSNGPTAQVPVYPQDLQESGQPVYLVDYAKMKIAVPYAPYTYTSATTAASYPQNMVLWIMGSDGQAYQEYLNVKPATPRDTAVPATANAPKDAQGVQYIPDTAANYQGGWFDPKSGFYADSADSTYPPAGVTWVRAILYRQFQPKLTGAAFSNDPYEFELPSPNIVDLPGMTHQSNIGTIAFNPLGAGRIGVKPLKAQITYQTFSWRILHEDRDIPAQSGAGNTTVVRLTLKNLRRAGDARPDNSIDPGLIPGASPEVSVIIQDLDTGKPITGTLIDEDTNGASSAVTSVNLSYAVGRLTFESNAFGDNPTGNTPFPHRVRIYYAGDADWTVAVQKAPSYYMQLADVAAGTDPAIAPGSYAFDRTTKSLFFPRCDANKTVTIQGITAYDNAGTAIPEPDVTVAIGDVVTHLGAASPSGTDYVSVNSLGLPAVLYAKGPGNAYVTFTAVRGLSARAVVAWKERDLWKFHSVDTVLTQTH